MAKRTPEHNAAIGAALRARGVGSAPTKRCPRCGKDLPRSAFQLRPNGFVKSYCVPCDRAYSAERTRRYREAHPELRDEMRQANREVQFRRKYGITLEDFERMNAEQDGRCAICGGGPSPRRSHLNVDHCHTEGHVRGLLCDPCNHGLGMFRDDPELLARAISYLS